MISRLVLIIGLLPLCHISLAQQGLFLSGGGIFQYSQVTNTQDYLTRTTEMTTDDTWKWGGTLGVIYNWEDRFGLETGLHYSQQGQNYSGIIQIGTDEIPYESGINLDYIKIPFLFRFNSKLGPEDNERVYLSIGAGFQMDVLTNVTPETEPSAADTSSIPIDFMDLYKNVSFSFTGTAIFHVQLSESVFLYSGFKLDISLGDIENKSYDYQTGTPLEYYFPVSTRKSQAPSIASRDAAKNNMIALLFGIQYRLSDLKK